MLGKLTLFGCGVVVVLWLVIGAEGAVRSQPPVCTAISGSSPDEWFYVSIAGSSSVVDGIAYTYCTASGYNGCLSVLNAASGNGKRAAVRRGTCFALGYPRTSNAELIYFEVVGTNVDKNVLRVDIRHAISNGTGTASSPYRAGTRHVPPNSMGRAKIRLPWRFDEERLGRLGIPVDAFQHANPGVLRDDLFQRRETRALPSQYVAMRFDSEGAAREHAFSRGMSYETFAFLQDRADVGEHLYVVPRESLIEVALDREDLRPHPMEYFAAIRDDGNRICQGQQDGLRVVVQTIEDLLLPRFALRCTETSCAIATISGTDTLGHVVVGASVGTVDGVPPAEMVEQCGGRFSLVAPP